MKENSKTNHSRYDTGRKWLIFWTLFIGIGEVALSGCAFSEFSVFRYRLADRERTDQLDSGSSASEKEETRRGSRRDIWDYPDTLDLHPVLYVPA